MTQKSPRVFPRVRLFSVGPKPLSRGDVS